MAEGRCTGQGGGQSSESERVKGRERQRSRDQETHGKRERWGHMRGMLMEGAETKKGTDFRVAAEEEVRI